MEPPCVSPGGGGGGGGELGNGNSLLSIGDTSIYPLLSKLFLASRICTKGRLTDTDCTCIGYWNLRLMEGASSLALHRFPPFPPPPSFDRFGLRSGVYCMHLILVILQDYYAPKSLLPRVKMQSITHLMKNLFIMACLPLFRVRAHPPSHDRTTAAPPN